MSDQPKVHRVYSVISKGEGKEPFWHNVGTAFPHKDSKGFNVLLEVLPIPTDGVAKLVIREIEPREAAEEDDHKKKTAEKRKPR
jgi:hypothetical protein